MHVFGFVEELVVADDPEYEYQGTNQVLQYRQSTRTSKNETRQSLLYLLDSSVRRRMCKKVLEMGGNAVLNYYQNFDMEGDSGLVARSYGTCVLIQRDDGDSGTGRDSDRLFSQLRLSDEGNERRGEMRMMHLANNSTTMLRTNRELSQEEVQLLTLQDFGPTVRIRFGGLVAARSVKYLGSFGSRKANLSDQETRDGWWSELRDEIRAHARTLCCGHVVVSQDRHIHYLPFSLFVISHVFALLSVILGLF